jgi:hypothetical protein
MFVEQYWRFLDANVLWRTDWTGTESWRCWLETRPARECSDRFISPQLGPFAGPTASLKGQNVGITVFCGTEIRIRSPTLGRRVSCCVEHQTAGNLWNAMNRHNLSYLTKPRSKVFCTQNISQPLFPQWRPITIHHSSLKLWQPKIHFSTGSRKSHDLPVSPTITV